jgi:hypothetical protein
MSNEDRVTVEEIREDLDNYGGHLRVLIESRDGNLFEVGAITGRSNWRGETVVTIEVGGKAD